MRTKLGIDAPAFGGYASCSVLPSRDALRPCGVLLEQIHPGANDIDFPVDAEARFQALDPAIIALLNHQRFAHICEYITKYTRACLRRLRAGIGRGQPLRASHAIAP